MRLMLVTAAVRRAMASTMVVLIQNASQLLARWWQVFDAFDDANIASGIARVFVSGVIARIDAKDAFFDHSTHRQRLQGFVLDDHVSRRLNRFRWRCFLQKDRTFDLLVGQPLFEDHRTRLRRWRWQAFDDDLTRLRRRWRKAFFDHVRSKQGSKRDRRGV